MKITKRILKHMPDFYRTWDEESIIFKLLFAFGKRLDECDRDLTYILRSHWVDTAFGDDLDKIAAIFNLKRRIGEDDRRFRQRIKRAIIDFKGGGTIQTILSSIRTLLDLPPDYPIKIVENPPQEVSKKIIVRTGTVWEMSSMSIYDVTPKIRLKVLDKGNEARNPSIENIDTGEKIVFKDVLKPGDVLEIHEEKAFLNGIDVTTKLFPRKLPTLTRRKCRWRYVEETEKIVGIFNQSVFDKSIFAIGIPQIELTFTWVSHLPATFMVVLPKNLLDKRGVSPDEVKEVIDFVKAVGVKSIIEIVGE